MNLKQKILLSCSVISYILTLFSLINYLDSWITVLFIVIHGIISLLLAYYSDTSATENSFDVELSIYQEQCAHLTEKNELLTKELERMQIKLNEFETALQKSSASNSSFLKTTPVPETLFQNSNNLLPPVGIEPELLNIIQIVKDTAKEFLPFFQKAGINLFISATSDELLVRTDLQRIQILFRNIIDNSIKYMQQAGNLTITLSTIGDDLFIILKDTGKGLPAEEVPHIFEMNYQGSNRISGNGLGLTQAKAIVESYGGTIYAKSTYGRGMGIYIQIPIK